METDRPRLPAGREQDSNPRFELSVPLWLGLHSVENLGVRSGRRRRLRKEEFEATARRKKSRHKSACAAADPIQLRAEKTDEVAKIWIVVEHDPLDVHEVSGNGFGAGGPIQIEPLGHTSTDGSGPASVCQ